MQAYSFFNLGDSSGWMINVTPRPLYSRDKDTVPTVHETG